MRLQARNRAGAVIPTASMADIVFLLIIFFILTFSIEVDKARVVMPKSTLRSEVPKKAAVVSITENGQMRVSDGDSASAAVSSPEDVLSFATGVIASNPEKEFILKADRNVPYKSVDRVLDTLKQARGTVVYLLSDQDTETGAGLFQLHVLYVTHYTFEGDALQIRASLFRWRVPLAAIDAVEPTRNPLSSPALLARPPAPQLRREADHDLATRQGGLPARARAAGPPARRGWRGRSPALVRRTGSWKRTRSSRRTDCASRCSAQATRRASASRCCSTASPSTRTRGDISSRSSPSCVTASGRPTSAAPGPRRSRRASRATASRHSSPMQPR